MSCRLLFGLIVMCLLGISQVDSAQSQALPVFSKSGPDAVNYGEAENYPVKQSQGARDQRNLVGNYSHLDQIRPSRLIAAPHEASELTRGKEELELAYQYQGKTETLASYLERTPVTGLLIMQSNKILFEHYQYARTDKDRLTSQTMAQGLVGILFGLALHEGKIRSLDDTVATYVPELAGRETGKTPLRNLLQMTSGLSFHEIYNGHDDIAQLSREMMRDPKDGPVNAVKSFDGRAAAPGAVFNYSSLDSELLGLVVSRATGLPLADLVQTRLWEPLGAEADASWITGASGHELAYCCFNATLRDWGRLGGMLSQDGAWNGKQIVPTEWLKATATSENPAQVAGNNGRRLGYGYQFWLMPGDRRQILLVGIYGQTMLIDPIRHVVLVQTAVMPRAADKGIRQELFALWQALVARMDAE